MCEYNLVELSTSSYTARTRRNIKESDGIVIFSLERLLSGGTKLTWENANKLGIPCWTSNTPRKNEDSTRIRFASRFKPWLISCAQTR